MAARKSNVTGICVAAAVALTGAAMATSASAANFLYTYTSNDQTQSATGELSATLFAPGEYEVTGGTIAALGSLENGSGALHANAAFPTVSTSPSGYFYYDDQLTPAQNPLITNPGLLFNVGDAEVNIFSNGPGPDTYQFYVNNGANDFGNFTISAVPEPATWAMMLLGLGALGVMLRTRKPVGAVAGA